MRKWRERDKLWRNSKIQILHQIGICTRPIFQRNTKLCASFWGYITPKLSTVSQKTRNSRKTRKENGQKSKNWLHFNIFMYPPCLCCVGEGEKQQIHKYGFPWCCVAAAELQQELTILLVGNKDKKRIYILRYYKNKVQLWFWPVWSSWLLVR